MNHRGRFTGTAGGIGRATSLLAARQGASVMAVYFADAVEETTGAIREEGGRAVSVRADIGYMARAFILRRREVDSRGCLKGLSFSYTLITRRKTHARTGQ